MGRAPSQPLNVLVTGAGSPATWGTLKALEHFPVGNVVTCDIKEGFDWKVSRPSLKFIHEIWQICVTESIRVIIPQVEDELWWFWAYHDSLRRDVDVEILVSEPVNKFDLLCASARLGDTQRFSIVHSNERGDHSLLMDTLFDFGLPVVVKLIGESGGRGTRVVKETLDWSDLESKPGDAISLADLHTMLGDKKYDLLIQEYLPGKEYTVDVLADNGKMLRCVPRTRDVIRSGITFEGVTVRNEEILRQCCALVEALECDYICGFQFKEDSEGVPHVTDINQRVQGTTIHSVLAGCNVILGAVRMAVGDKWLPPEPTWGVKMRRYWGCSVQ